MEQELNIVFTGNRKALIGLCVAAKSTLDACSRPVNIYVINTDFYECEKKRLLKSWNIAKSVSFIDVKKKILRTYNLVHRNLRHIESNLKFYIGDLLPQHIHKCFLMDPDLIVTDDLSVLSDLDLENYIAGAALDISASDLSVLEKRKKNYYLKNFHQFLNSGFFLINLDLWRKENIGTQLKNYVKENYLKLLTADQDAFNIVLEDKWFKLEQKWNLSQYDKNAFPNHKGIIHLIGPIKPWHIDYKYKFKDIFYQVLDTTDFKGWRPSHCLGLADFYWSLERRYIPFDVVKKKIRREFNKIFNKNAGIN
jgi:lipopolysaccharide biosynthesis glycosyltransferase